VGDPLSGEKRVACPLCQAPIVEGARKCRACKRWLPEPSPKAPRLSRAFAILLTAVSTVLAVLVSRRPSIVGDAPPLTRLPTDATSLPAGAAAPAPGSIGPEPEVEPEAKPLDLSRPWKAREIRIGEPHPLDIVWNPNGKSVYVSADDATLREYRIKNGDLVHQASVPAQGDRIRLLFDRYVAVLRRTDAARIPVMDTTTWDRDPILLDVGRSPGDIVGMPDGHTVVAASIHGKRVTRFDLPTGAKLGDITLAHATGGLYTVKTSEGRPLVAAMGSLVHGGQPAGAWVDLFDPAEGPFGATRRSTSVGREPRPGAVSSDGSFIFFPDRVSNTAVLLRVAAVTEARTVAVGQGPAEGFLMNDDRYGVTINATAHTATIVALPSMEAKGTLILKGVPCSGEVTRDKKTLFVTLGGGSYPPKGSGVAVLAGDPPRVVAQLPTGHGACNIAVNADGTRIAVANYQSKSITILEQ
jgi:DNA-binding beta-propeller fold protein YncE